MIIKELKGHKDQNYVIIFTPDTYVAKDYNIKFNTTKLELEDFYKNLKALFIFKKDMGFIPLGVSLNSDRESVSNKEVSLKGKGGKTLKVTPSSGDVFTDQVEAIANEIVQPFINFTDQLQDMFGGTKSDGTQGDPKKFWLGVAKGATKGLSDMLSRAGETETDIFAQAMSKGWVPLHGERKEEYEGKEAKANKEGKAYLRIHDFNNDRVVENSLVLYDGSITPLEWGVTDITLKRTFNFEGDGLNSFELKGLNTKEKFSLYDVLTASMFEAFNYYAYFTKTDNTKFDDFEIDKEHYEDGGINFHYLFFIDKIKIDKLKMNEVNKIGYGMFDINTFKESNFKASTKITFNILGDEVLTFYRYITQKSTGMHQGLVGTEEYFNLHIIVPGEYETEIGKPETNAILKENNVHAWHFLFENCKFTGVDKLKFDNKKDTSLPVHNVEMVYKQGWLYDEIISSTKKEK